MLVPNLEDLLPLRARAKELSKYKKMASRESLAGSLQTKFKGQGLDFYQVRKYVAGDEIRSIDWRVTARTGKPHVKEFIEEKEANIDIICDVGPQMQFASHGRFKYILAAEIVSLLSFAAEQNKEKIKASFYGENLDEQTVIRQKNQKSVALQIVNFLCLKRSLSVKNVKNNLISSLHSLNVTSKDHGVCFIIATNLEPSEELKTELLRLSQKKQVYLVQLVDKLESELPDAGIISFKDFNGKKATLNLSDKKARSFYKAAFTGREKKIKDMCKNTKTRLITLNTEEDALETLVKGLRG